MSIAAKNFTILRGDTKPYKLVFKNPDGDPVDVSGYKVMFTAKADTGDADNAAKISKTITVTDGTSGEVELVLSASDTDIDAGIYVYDVQLVAPSGNVHTPLNGTMTVEDDVTKRTS